MLGSADIFISDEKDQSESIDTFNKETKNVVGDNVMTNNKV